MEITDVPVPTTSNVAKEKVSRCLDWIKEQNSEPDKLSFILKNQNDIQFIVENNETRKNFMLSSVVDTTVPAGVDEEDIKPVKVPVQRLRFADLRLECEWQSCRMVFYQYEEFQKHVTKHINELQVIKTNSEYLYVCLWDACGYKTSDGKLIFCHINYHSYHAKLMAMGFNARATLNLAVCKKDSSKRNQFTDLKSIHVCMWIGCKLTFDSMQKFIDHARVHAALLDNHLCSWAGCGTQFNVRGHLITHLRTHTGEKRIACYHCGCHFVNFRKLSEHVHRQNADSSGLNCAMCGVACGSAYLLREHERNHVSTHACSYCDITMPTLATLASHVRYRHMDNNRHHACSKCDYRAKAKFDLKRHIETVHNKKKKLSSEDGCSDEEMSDSGKKKNVRKRYCCHMCPADIKKTFCRGAKLTVHLVRVHGVQLPCGHCRFRYQISEDGMYRLTTTRYESLEVSQKIMERKGAPDPLKADALDLKIEKVVEATETNPIGFTFGIKEKPKEVKTEQESNADVEITMCDVDEYGNIISSEVIQSDVFFS